MEQQQLAQAYYENTEMNFREQIDAMDELFWYKCAPEDEKLLRKLNEFGMPRTHEDMEYIENRVYHDYVSKIDFEHIQNPQFGEDSFNRNWAPYEQDLSQYPEVLRKYQENYKLHDDIKAKMENEDVLEDADPGMFQRRLPKDRRPWEQKYDTVMPRYTGTSAQ